MKNHWLKDLKDCCPICDYSLRQVRKSGYWLICCDNCDRYAEEVHYDYPQTDYYIDGEHHIVTSGPSEEEQAEIDQKRRDAIKLARSRYLYMQP